MNKIILITPGESAGVGPQICTSLGKEHIKFKNAYPVLIANAALLESVKHLYDPRVHIVKIEAKLLYNQEEFLKTVKAIEQRNYLLVIDVPLVNKVIPGKLDVKNAPYVLETLNIAHQLLIDKKAHALVTGPISKENIANMGIKFTGHTEYLQELCHKDEVVMMLGCKKFKVALVTTHLPLNQVSLSITKEKLTNIITILHHDLIEKFGIKKPCIYISGLNPHAGEGGHLGDEEQKVIIPVIQKLKNQGMNLIGPLACDTMFIKENIKKASAFLTMYHDQGLVVLKYAGFDTGYNTTLGLPYIRTSVDHGTALSLAGTNKASEKSLHIAFELAYNMAKNKDF